MLDRKPQTDAQGVLTITIEFYEAEATMYRNGEAEATMYRNGEAEGFLVMLSNTAKNKLHDAGGLGPYSYSCRGGDGNISPHIFVAIEREF